MVKIKPKNDRQEVRSLIREFSLGIAKKAAITVKDQQTIEKKNIDFCLPPLLVEAFQSGLEEEINKCDCNCGEEHDCTYHVDSSGDHGCGGCHNHD